MLSFLTFVRPLHVVLMAVFGCCFSATAAKALTPESPEVRAAVTKGMKYLAGKSKDERMGAYALLGRVFVYDLQPDHPQVKVAVEAIEKAANFPRTADIYSIGLAIVFLIEHDVEANRPTIQKLLDHLLQVQKPNGGWGYPDRPSGDTSMTQYAVLALWTASNAEFETPLDAWTRVTQWLLRTQDPSGSFGYQGIESVGDQLVVQAETGPTMSAAGLGCLYLCGDYLGLAPLAVPPPANELTGDFKRVKVVVKEKPREVKKTDIDPARFKAALARASAWFEAHQRNRNPTFTWYFFYTYERTQSAREAATGKALPVEPAWYTDAARTIIAGQRPEGNWSGEEQDVAATSFAILCLIRSGRRMIEKAHHYGAGTLVGGRGLPANGAEVALRLGKVVAKPLTGPAEELLAKIEDPRNPEYLRAIEALENMNQTADAETLSANARRLRQLAASDDPEARATALGALARSRKFDQVPLFIEALQDPEPLVVEAARAALRFVSRRTTPDPIDTSPAARRTEVERWKRWYLAIHPDANFDQ